MRGCVQCVLSNNEGFDAMALNVTHSHRFKSMPNFRRLVPTRISDSNDEDRSPKRGGSLNLFRSSRPDNLTAEEVDMFVHLNIRSVIDLRSASEYRRTDGPKLLDAVYPVYKVALLVLALYSFGEHGIPEPTIPTALRRAVGTALRRAVGGCLGAAQHLNQNQPRQF